MLISKNVTVFLAVQRNVIKFYSFQYGRALFPGPVLTIN